MSGGFSLLGGYANASSYSVSSTAVPGGANTKGAWTQIVASLPHDVGAIAVPIPAFYNAGNNTASLDIGVGGSGSEVAIINNLVGTIDAATAYCQTHVLFPVSVPAGARLAARVQLASISGSPAWNGSPHIILFDTDFIAPSAAPAVDSLGFNAATTCGTSVTPGTGSAGSYATIVSSTSYDYQGLMAVFDGTASLNNNDNITAIDIAVGAAASEKIIVPQYVAGLRFGSAFTSNIITPWFMCPIPAGSRIAVRGNTNNTAAAFGVTLYGLRK